MKSVSRSVRLMLTVVFGLAMSAAFTAPASAAVQTESPASEATWELSDYEQHFCGPVNSNYFTYFVGFISGYWTSPLVSEVEGFPEGTEFEVSSAIPPGDNGDKSIGTIWIGVDLPPLDYGDYPATLTVTDGTSTQTMPILITIQDRWGCGIATASNGR